MTLFSMSKRPFHYIKVTTWASMVHTLPEPAEFRPSPGNRTPKRGFLEAAPSEGFTQAMKAT